MKCKEKYKQYVNVYGFCGQYFHYCISDKYFSLECFIDVFVYPHIVLFGVYTVGLTNTSMFIENC